MDFDHFHVKFKILILEADKKNWIIRIFYLIKDAFQKLKNVLRNGK